MIYQYNDVQVGGRMLLQQQEKRADRRLFDDLKSKPLSILFNPTETPIPFELDGQPEELAGHSALALSIGQHFKFSDATGLVMWQFNREFYCVVDHDEEVSCSGLLFFGSISVAPLQLSKSEVEVINALLRVFVDEFAEADKLQGEMLRVLLKRLIVKMTRLYKLQYVNDDLKTSDVDLVRKFNLLVELNYKQLHQVQDYAEMLNKSPKTLSNYFRQHSGMSPLQHIKNRKAIEAKRLLLYTDKSASEIGFELGFDDPAHFSRFFKKQVGISPGSFKKAGI